jgi:ABC-type glycerol-3-phosphate transport system substrate-binding protein
MSLRITRVAALLVLLVLVSGCGQSSSNLDLPSGSGLEPASAPNRGPMELTILHTNDNWGETDPCG